jgi:hypothetical protein
MKKYNNYKFILSLLLLTISQISFSQTYWVSKGKTSIQPSTALVVENISLKDNSEVYLDDSTSNINILNDIYFSNSQFSGNGNINMKGNVSQNISGKTENSTLYLNGNDFNINSIEVITDASINMTSGNISLVNGIVRFFNDDIFLMLDESATATNYSDQSFVDGKIIKLGNTEFIFPIGHVTSRTLTPNLGEREYIVPAFIKMKPVSGTTTSMSAVYKFSNEGMPDWWRHGDNMDATIYSVSNREYWKIDSDSDLDYVEVFWMGNTDCLQLGADACKHPFCYIDENGEHVVTDIDFGQLFTLALHDDSKWIDLNGHLSSGGHNSGSIISTVEEGIAFKQEQTKSIMLSELPESSGKILSFASLHDILPLPVELLEFNAEPANFAISLNWVTASEINSDKFEIERSENAINFTKIGELKGSGNSKIKLNYNYYDNNVKPNVVYYYRIKQVDYDGVFSYSPIRSAMLNDGGSIFDIYPNPAENNIFISTSFDFYRIEIINEQGIVVFSSENDKEINIEQLPPNLYIVKVITKNEVLYKNFIKI